MSVAEIKITNDAEDGLFDWPLFGLQDDIRPALEEARSRGVWAVLATLYGVSGAAPRGAGAQMVFTEDSVVGFLSGGCIEADLAVQARKVLARQKSQRCVYGEGGPMDIRLPCGSRIEVLLEPLAPNDGAVARLLKLQGERRPALWLTDGDNRLCGSVDGMENLPDKLRPIAALATSGDQMCGYLQTPFAVFRTSDPPRRLTAIGADPIALAVVKLAAEVGFETTLIRPNGPEACPLPGINYDRSDVRNAIASSRPDRWTAVAILTHETEQEHAALTAALDTDAGYVGALGSRRRVPDRNARLLSFGVALVDVERVHAPIGLPIGGKSPWEIAVSVIAEIVSEMDKQSANRQFL